MSKRPMPATYAEPKRRNSVAHLAWERGFTWTEWTALKPEQRRAETLRAMGKPVGDAGLSNAQILARLRSAR